MKTEIEIIKSDRNLLERGKNNKVKKLRVAAYCRVSTDDADQLNSYESQVKHYNKVITQNPDWIYVGIYADKAITGTKIDKRDDFKRLISDCMNGEIDLILTKSIARFARNTVDTLKYVRMLKEKYVAVLFEEEKINTITMDGELLLTVLSSVAQQEVENISANVKKGLKMKMQRGEIVGYNGCLGYNYNKKNKTITVNKEEAEIVKYIFNRYIDGYGAFVIAKELNAMGVPTKRGSINWHSSGVTGIIKNEKYIGDMLMGKTFTVDPITKRRLSNMGEEDKVYIRNHHEPIISKTVFYKAQEILALRGGSKIKGQPYNRKKYSRQYAFSSLLKCGFCGDTLSRRAWNSGARYEKTVWHCITNTLKGKSFCKNSKGVDEKLIENAFLESFKLIANENADLLDNFLLELSDTLSDNGNKNSLIDELEQKIFLLKQDKNTLLDLLVKGQIDNNDFSSKKSSIDDEITELEYQKSIYSKDINTSENLRERIKKFREFLSSNVQINEFDRGIFESLIKCVIIGGYDSNNKPDPMLITFVYKCGTVSEVNIINNIENTNFKDDDGQVINYKEVFDFNFEYNHTVFSKDENEVIHKRIEKYCLIKVAIAI